MPRVIKAVLGEWNEYSNFSTFAHRESLDDFFLKMFASPERCSTIDARRIDRLLGGTTWGER